jgi:hypothetical protein
VNQRRLIRAPDIPHDNSFDRRDRRAADSAAVTPSRSFVGPTGSAAQKPAEPAPDPTVQRTGAATDPAGQPSYKIGARAIDRLEALPHVQREERVAGGPESSMDPRPLPEPHDTTRFHWEAAAEGCLSIQRCGPCQKPWC